MNDNSILPHHTKYIRRYYHNDIFKEEIKLLYCAENMFFFQFEYYTSIMNIDDNVEFSKSKANCSRSNYCTNDTTQVPKSENQSHDEYEIVLKLTDRPLDDKEILITNMSAFVKGTKLIYRNNENVDNAVSSLVRYVLYNSNTII